MKLLFIFLLFFSYSYGEGIDDLLADYEETSDLSLKTKNEATGNLIVYTRDDLERMQVESLHDILKSLRFFSYTENRMGQPDMFNIDPLSYYSKGIRVYLDETELLTAITGSGFFMFGDMEMDFIDHVEIYQTFPSFDFGVEPATVVIRLYSKTAQRDSGGRVKANIGSYGTNKENVYYADQNDDVSYFLYANRTDERRDSYNYDTRTLKRDKITERFYASVKSENHTLTAHVQLTHGDAFLGSLIGQIPQSTDLESQYIGISTNSEFMDDTLTLNLAYTNGKTDIDYKYADNAPILIDPSDPYNPLSYIRSLEQHFDEETVTASLKKEWDISDNLITLGFQYRYKGFNLEDFSFDTFTPNFQQAFDTENVYSLFIQDNYSITQNHLITASIMGQMYDRNGEGIDTQETLQLRLGYIYTDDTWVAKTFLSYQEFASDPYSSISPDYGNPYLKKDTYSSLFQEVSYEKGNTLSRLVLGFGQNNDLPTLEVSPTKIFLDNYEDPIDAYLASLEFTYFFRTKDKLELQTSYFYIENPYDTSDYSDRLMLMARMLNTFGKFDIYNEFLLMHLRFGLGTGYDYSAGIKYNVSQDFYLNLKGENLFDQGQETAYLKNYLPGDKIQVPIVERKVIFGMEYLF